MAKIIRVFPRKTNATPTDEDVRINMTPSLFDEADEVHISVTFTWDLKRGEWLYKQWKGAGFNTKISGVATGERGGDFVAGMYLKKGYTITSRGCNNNCWFCTVPQREGGLRELSIVEGYNVLDDNLLACSREHKDKVFEMLKRQKQRPQFTGGLEAKILTKEDAEKLYQLKPKTMFFAYDTPDDYEHLVNAGKILREVGFKQSSQIARCYVLVGFHNDTFEKAERRLRDAWAAGFFPFAMLYRDFEGKYSQEWKRFQKVWAAHQVVATKIKEAN
jgi:hypothetical protein